MIISTYWPYDSDSADNGLAAGLTRWMEKCNRSGSAMDYIQDRIHRLILNQQANSSNATIVCGDFNACYHKHAGCKVSKQKAAERIESLADEVTKEAQEINLVINDKPPSKAFKKIGPDVKREEAEVKAVKKELTRGESWIQRPM